jgi:hypothetical protein
MVYLHSSKTFSDPWNLRRFSKTSGNRPEQSIDITRLLDTTPQQNHKPGRKKRESRSQVHCTKQMKLAATGYASKDFSSSRVSLEQSTSELAEVKEKVR